MTDCIQETFGFTAHFSRRVEVAFNAGAVSSDGGALLLREADRKIRLVERAASCFRDGRDPGRIEHPLGEMLAKRLYGLALGYEDLSDHEQLRAESATGAAQRQARTGWSAGRQKYAERLELAGRSPRYPKIGYSPEAFDRLRRTCS